MKARQQVPPVKFRQRPLALIWEQAVGNIQDIGAFRRGREVHFDGKLALGYGGPALAEPAGSVQATLTIQTNSYED
jgi:hypothetical protein